MEELGMISALDEEGVAVSNEVCTDESDGEGTDCSDEEGTDVSGEELRHRHVGRRRHRCVGRRRNKWLKRRRLIEDRRFKGGLVGHRNVLLYNH